MIRGVGIVGEEDREAVRGQRKEREEGAAGVEAWQGEGEDLAGRR